MTWAGQLRFYICFKWIKKDYHRGSSKQRRNYSTQVRSEPSRPSAVSKISRCCQKNLPEVKTKANGGHASITPTCSL